VVNGQSGHQRRITKPEEEEKKKGGRQNIWEKKPKRRRGEGRVKVLYPGQGYAGTLAGGGQTNR